MIAFVLGAWRLISAGASTAWRTVKASKPLQYFLIGLATLAALIFGYRRAIKNAKRAGAREEREQIVDKIEKDTKNVIEKIEEAEREVIRELGPPPVIEERREGEGLESDPFNARQLERLQERANNDPRNRGNPRSTPRSDV